MSYNYYICRKKAAKVLKVCTFRGLGVDHPVLAAGIIQPRRVKTKIQREARWASP